MLLACAPEDAHVLPLHALAVALAERRVPVRTLGPRVPATALASATRRLGASAVFVWRQLADGPTVDLDTLPSTGRGWSSWWVARVGHRPTCRRAPGWPRAWALPWPCSRPPRGDPEGPH